MAPKGDVVLRACYHCAVEGLPGVIARAGLAHDGIRRDQRFLRAVQVIFEVQSAYWRAVSCALGQETGE